jgi:hypothetical protein
MWIIRQVIADVYAEEKDEAEEEDKRTGEVPLLLCFLEHCVSR